MIPRWLRNRWVVVPGLLALLVACWNIYVGQHANGVVAGRVVDAQGNPVASVSVTLFNRSFITGNASHAIQLQAAAPGFAPTPRKTVRLLFRAQDVHMTEPLRLSPP
jgi:hypothetical protein